MPYTNQRNRGNLDKLQLSCRQNFRANSDHPAGEQGPRYYSQETIPVPNCIFSIDRNCSDFLSMAIPRTFEFYDPETPTGDGSLGAWRLGDPKMLEMSPSLRTISGFNIADEVVKNQKIETVAGIALALPSTVLFTKSEIAAAVVMVSKLIAEWVAEKEGDAPVIAVVLNGGKYYGNLLQNTGRLPFKVVEVQASSYSNDTTQRREVRLFAPWEEFEGKRVLLVDDVFDTGNTIRALRAKLHEFGASEVVETVLVNKIVPGMDRDITVRFPALIYHGDFWLGGAGMDMVNVPDREARNYPNIIGHPPLT